MCKQTFRVWCEAKVVIAGYRGPSRLHLLSSWAQRLSCIWIITRAGGKREQDLLALDLSLEEEAVVRGWVLILKKCINVHSPWIAAKWSRHLLCHLLPGSPTAVLREAGGRPALHHGAQRLHQSPIGNTKNFTQSFSSWMQNFSMGAWGGKRVHDQPWASHHIYAWASLKIPGESGGFWGCGRAQGCRGNCLGHEGWISAHSLQWLCCSLINLGDVCIPVSLSSLQMWGDCCPLVVVGNFSGPEIISQNTAFWE